MNIWSGNDEPLVWHLKKNPHDERVNQLTESSPAAAVIHQNHLCTVTCELELLLSPHSELNISARWDRCRDKTRDLNIWT